MGLVKFKKDLTSSQFSALEPKDINTIYFISDTGEIYIGSDSYGTRGITSISAVEGNLVAAGPEGDIVDSEKKFTDEITNANDDIPTAAAVYDAMLRVAPIWIPSEESVFSGFVVDKSEAVDVLSELCESASEWKEYREFALYPNDLITPLTSESSILSDLRTVKLNYTSEAYHSYLDSGVLPAGSTLFSVNYSLQPDRNWHFAGTVAIRREGVIKTLGAGVFVLMYTGQLKCLADIPLSETPQYLDTLLINVSGEYVIKSQDVPDWDAQLAG
jgi:hypothetical protein